MQNNNSQINNFENVKNKKDSKIGIKRIKKNVKCIKLSSHNPGITHFNLYSHFIYDLNNINSYINKIPNLSHIKLNSDEKNFLDKRINEINDEIEAENNTEFIFLSKELSDKISNYFKVEKKASDLELFIKDQFQKIDDRRKLTCRNLAKLYSNCTGKIVHKTNVNNIIRNKLGLHYLKTSVKTSKINSDKNMFISFCFVKILVRALKLGFKILYLDESAILGKNNNYKCWRGKKENIFFDICDKKRKNLLMLISQDEVIHYSLNDNTTNEESFLLFIQECVNKLISKNFVNYIIIMDNLSCHKTSKLFQFYFDNKVNVLFNTPYASYFNSIELAFRCIKKKLYSKLFKDFDEINNEVKNIINEDGFKKTLLGNYKETLNRYKFFSLENEYININILNTQ